MAIRSLANNILGKSYTVTIPAYLHSCSELSRFCRHNGWIDDGTLRYHIVEEEERAVIAAIEFEEIVMEGTTCVAGRVSCFGRLRILLDENGEVKGSEFL